MDSERVLRLKRKCTRQGVYRVSKKKRNYGNPFRLETEQGTLDVQPKKKSSLIKRILRLLVGMLLILGVSGTLYVHSVLQPVSSVKVETVEVEIVEGSSTRDISELLKTKGMIQDASMFRLYVKFKNVDAFQAGYYQLSPSMSVDEIIETLQKGGSDISVNAARVVVREGETIETIANTVASTTSFTKEEFLEAIQNESFLAELASQYPTLLSDAVQATQTRYSLEGYLYPATYTVTRTTTVKTLIQEMVSKMDSVMKTYEAVLKEQQKTPAFVLTLASLVEREGVTLEDRKLIAGVFYNRLKESMPLQSDISILYALNTVKEVVTLADLEVDSLYNLYTHTGVGPGPFNNPSKEAIEAVLYPTQTEYMYFLADTKTGKVYYSKTYEEHLELVEKYINQ